VREGWRSRRGVERGQLSLPLIEAALGVLVILAITGGFALGVPMQYGDHQLDLYASDTATVLAAEVAAGNGTVFAAKEPARGALRAHLDGILPPNCMYRATTPWGRVGYPRPPGVTVGRATRPSAAGPITVEVWRV